MGGRGKTKTENGALEGGDPLRIADRPSEKGGVTDVTVGNGRFFDMMVQSDAGPR